MNDDPGNGQLEFLVAWGTPAAGPSLLRLVLRIGVGVLALRRGVEFFRAGLVLDQPLDDHRLLRFEHGDLGFLVDEFVRETVHLSTDGCELVQLAEVPGRRGVEQCL